eukprot:TRINITY_DN3858_c0_g1_i1.p1 TRINITY_DN3858_c0_g1~~TRINITY_DN3858_c0_g1_i1.p1  ORF type:complete len:849 (-),score=230.83 TRINITY_DN3858_c0_g1_i1:69-2333(-)
MPVIWEEYGTFLAGLKRITQCRRTFDRALRSLPVTQHYKIWPAYLKFVRACGVSETAIRVYRRYLKMEPEQAEDYVEYLRGIEKWDEAAKWLARLVNEEHFSSRKGKTKHQLWLELCEIASKHPENLAELNFEQVIRSGLRKFTDETGKLWTSLADYFIRLGEFERGRDIFEEAISTVTTVRDFTQVYEAYTQFEETMIAAKMDAQRALAESAPSEAGAEADQHDNEVLHTDLDLRLTRLEFLVQRRPELVNSVLLRQNPHNVFEWHERVKIFEGEPQQQINTYVAAVKSVDPMQATGKVQSLWANFAKFYENGGDLAHARAVFQRAVQSRFKTVDDLAAVWCEWAEMEIRHKNYKEALAVLEQATTAPPKDKRKSFFDEKASVQERVYKSVRLWSFYADLQESLGTFEQTKAVYEKVLDLRIATPQIILNYATFLEEHKYFEESFRVYEKGVSIFVWPAVKEIWLAYLDKFVARFGAKKLERARDLYEQALDKIPPSEAQVFYSLYARLEETHGLTRNALAIFARAVKVVPDEQKLDVYNTYLAKAGEHFGIAHTRSIFQEALDTLPDKLIKPMCLRFADMENKLGEIDRARAIYTYGSQFCDPKRHADFWSLWSDFEVRHGNEDTYREMLRVKRSVQATFNTTFNFVSATEAATLAAQETGVKRKAEDNEAMAALEQQVLGKAARTDEAPTATAARTVQFHAAAAMMDEDPDIQKEEEQQDNVDLEEKSVPAAVFGSAKLKGALARFKKAGE